MAKRKVRIAPRPGVSTEPPLLLDAGGVFGLARDDLRGLAYYKTALRRKTAQYVSSVTLSEVRRGHGPRDAPVNRILSTCDVVPVDEVLGNYAGHLLADAGSSDTIDAIVVATAISLGGAIVVTSDPTDLKRLADCRPGSGVRLANV